MTTLAELADRVERLLLRHRELQRTNALLERHLDAVTAERDSLRTRLTQARTRLDDVLARMPDTGTPDARDTRDTRDARAADGSGGDPRAAAQAGVAAPSDPARRGEPG